MIELKHKVGDKVLVKDLEWYNKNKNENDEVIISALGPVFTRRHSKYAGKVMTVGVVSKLGFYVLKEDKEGNRWYDEMFDTLVEEEIKPKFKVGDKITNGEITFTILTLSSDRYGAEDTFGECGSVCFKSQDDWKIVEEEMNRVDELLDEYKELTDRAFKGGYEKCKSDIELNGFQLPEGYQFVDENGNVINAQKIILEKKPDDKLKLESTKKVREYWSEYTRIFIEIYDDDPNECILTHLHTLEGHRQKGHAKKALAEAELIAKELGCHKAHLKVETDSWMHHWYLRCGYTWKENAPKGCAWLTKNL